MAVRRRTVATVPPVLVAVLMATGLHALPGSATVASVAPAALSAAPSGSPILISEVANGGGGADSNAARIYGDNFIEIANFGGEPVDVSGWRILRCGQIGDVYGPQKVIPADTTLAPGETYTVAGLRANAMKVPRDAVYDATGTDLHEFGFGAWLETPGYDVVDRVGFYHSSVSSECGEGGRTLERALDLRLSQSHQRVASTGNVETDWIVGTRTPDAPNTGEPRPGRVDSPLRISEVANGDGASDANQYVELTNYGSEAVDVSGWKLYRCDESTTTNVQIRSLPAGSVIAPGATYLIAHVAAQLGGAQVDATYATGMHWRDFGAMIVRPDDRIVDGVGFYDNRTSMCTEGDPKDDDADALQAESYHRVGDTGDNDSDFMLARERTPGIASHVGSLTAPAGSAHGALRISELVGAGDGGSDDEFVEIANYGSNPIDMTGYTLSRCEGTGKGGVGAQVTDLGDRTLAPGEVYVIADDGAQADVLAEADATYTTGMNEVAGYGAYLRAPDGTMADAVGVYESITYSPCVAFGSELRNYTKNDLDESYQRARITVDNEEDFMKTPGRTPGVLADIEWVDPTEPMPGELDPIELGRRDMPGTPQASEEQTGEGYGAVVTTEDADGGVLEVAVREAMTVSTEGTRIFAGSTDRRVPAGREVTGEAQVATAPSLTTEATGSAFPFQRFEIPATEVAEGGWEFTWTGATRDRNEVQLYAWDPAEGGRWVLRTAGSPSADGDLTLVGELTPEHVRDGAVNVLVIDGPRTEGGAVEEIGVIDRTFLDPWQYDFAFNHASDTQYLAEGFRDVYRRMATWVVANAEARKIGYAMNSGDLIENWTAGNSDKVRARKEFTAAKKIQQHLNEANVPNGVLPGNHDNLWGRDNRLYNEYFGPEMYQNESWWGASWRPGDNSAHYDFVEAGGLELLMLSLPFRATQEQIDWAREVAASYPRHNVVVNTHSYIRSERDLENRGDHYTARGEDIWTDLVSPSDNIFLVLGGHYHGVATLYGDPVTGEQSDAIEIAEDAVAVRNVGETGRRVVQMRANYQGYRSSQPEPRGDTLDRDSGFQRLLQMDFDAELMAANAYSPRLGSFEPWRYDEPGHRGNNARYTAADDEFVAKIDLLVDKSVETSDWGLTEASTEADTVTVASGQPAEVDLPAATLGSTFYARVTDDTGQTVTSAPVTIVQGPAGPRASATTLSVSPRRHVYGASRSDRIQVSSTVTTTDGESAGVVEFREGARVLASDEVSDGAASSTLPRDLAAGRHAIRATFVPADTTTRSSTSDPVQVRVTKARSTVSSRLADDRIGPRQRGRMRVTVTAPGAQPRGKVDVTVRGPGRDRTAVGTLGRGGRVTVILPRLSRGDYRVVASYRGSSSVAPGRAEPARLRVA